MNTEYKLIVFDWDGTLVDSIPHMVKSLRRTASFLGLVEKSDSYYSQWLGANLSDLIRLLYPDISESLRLRYQEIYEKECVDGVGLDYVKFFAGVQKGLVLLKQAGYQLAVVTGRDKKSIQSSTAWGKCKHFFDFLQSGDQVASKPDPQMLNIVLKKCSVLASEAIMVGDTMWDLMMAKKLHMDAVAVSYGAHDISVLKKHSPIAIVHKFSQLCTLLLSKIA